MRYLISVAVLLAGCATQKPVSWSATGGSRSDATVQIGYQYNPTVVIPVTDDYEADRLASERCQAWGFETADRFGVQRTQCQQVGTGLYDGECINMWVTLEYQCIGDGSSLEN